MRYCNNCGEKRDWPIDTLVTVRGPCEICGHTCICNDLHHSRLPIPEPKVRLSFAPIDAKDNAVVGITGPNGFTIRPKSEYNAKLICEAMREYLKRLKELQANIVFEFGPQFKEEPDIESEDGFCGTNNCPCEHDKNGQLPCEMGSGLQDLYYT